MLIEVCLGGELFNYLHSHPTRHVDYIPEEDARFYAACVLDAFEYLHDKMIVYRDLKPENLLIDAVGYLKVVDFGFAKVVTDRTYTLCGTPEYLSPELVLGKGHHKGVDYWALGVLIYEMVVGYSPFAGENTPDQMVICRNILAGKYDVPKRVQGADIKDMMRRLMSKQVTHRLGCLKAGASDIKSHAWYKSLNWDALKAKQVASPWVPEIAGAEDTSHFDPFDDEDEDEAYKGDSAWADGF